MRRVSGCGFLCLFVFVAGGFPGRICQAGPPGPIELKIQPGILTEVETALTDSDQLVDGKFRKTYRISLEKGKTYQFDAVALHDRLFDPYLMLLAGNRNVVKEDDDGAGKPNARLTVTPETAADFLLVVTTFPRGQTGAYRLSVGEPGARAIPVPLTLAAGRATLAGQLTRAEPMERGKKCRIFTCDFVKGTTYLVRLTSVDFDPYLYVVAPLGLVVAEDDDGDGNLSSRILWTADQTGTFKLLVTSLAGKETGAFTLSIAEAAPNEPLRVKMRKHTSDMTGELAADAPRYNGKPSRAYMLRMEKDKTYQIDLGAKSFDAYLYLLGPDGTVVAQDDDSGGNLNARIVYRANEAGEYRIQACSLDPGGKGKYALRIVERPPQIDLTKAARLVLQNGQVKEGARLVDSDPKIGGKVCRPYAVELQEGRSYQIDLVSADFDAYLYLFGPDRKLLAVDDDGGGDLNARIVHAPRATGIYYVIACPLEDPGDGNFTLSVAETVKR